MDSWNAPERPQPVSRAKALAVFALSIGLGIAGWYLVGRAVGAGLRAAR